jgi:hypothetical protein
LIKPVRDDRDLVLPYQLTSGAVLSLAAASDQPIEPANPHYYFEASDVSDAGAEPAKAATAR